MTFIGAITIITCAVAASIYLKTKRIGPTIAAVIGGDEIRRTPPRSGRCPVPEPRQRGTAHDPATAAHPMQPATTHITLKKTKQTFRECEE